MGCFFSFILKKSGALIVKRVVEEVNRKMNIWEEELIFGCTSWSAGSGKWEPWEMWSGRAAIDNFFEKERFIT
jgi:hypothetical protein